MLRLANPQSRHDSFAQFTHAATMTTHETPSTDDFINGLPAHLQPLAPPGPPHGDRHRQRRHRLAQTIAARGGGLVILGAGNEIARNRDNHFPFRSHSDFLYMTGFPEPEAWWLMRVEPDGNTRDVIVCRPRDTDREIWDGVRVGPQRAADRYGFDTALGIADLDATAVAMAANLPAIYSHPASSAELDHQFRIWLGKLRSQARAGVSAPAELVDVGQLIALQRQVKDADEILTMTRAAEVSAAAHVEAMQHTRSGMREYEIEAVLLHAFRRAGAQSVAYGSIVAGGPHSCILHHRAGDRVCLPGELVLIDAGCELDGYASDITRTFPVSGRFSAAQRAAYDVVCAAQSAAVEASRMGAMIASPHEAAVRVLAQGMIDLGLLPGHSCESAIESGAYRRFYMHRTGHWLGLDVHDVGDYTLALTDGMVLTIEPGLYIRPAPDVREEFWNVGIRIEDDALITAEGPRLLTRGVPVDAAAIESLMAS